METKASPTVSIVVVNYKTRPMTLDCLRSIIAETKDVTYEIILVDNASNDGTISEVRRQFSEVHCIPLTTNVGFAHANNIAAKRAKGHFLLLLNPDTVVLDRAVDRLVRFAVERPQARIWGGQSLDGNRALDPTSCWRRLTLWSVICRTFGLDTAFPNSRILSREAYAGWDRLSVRAVDIVCGCFMLIDRTLWDQLGGFDKLFFMYGEEADFCLRAALVGARPAFTPDAVIIHYGGASEQNEAEKIIRKLGARSELIRRHLSPATRRLGLFINALLPLVRAAGYGFFGAALIKPEAAARAATWWHVWMQRTNWQFGLRPRIGGMAPSGSV